MDDGMTLKMTPHFVRLTLVNKIYKTQVSTDGCSYVDDFKSAIKIKFAPDLETYAITIHHQILDNDYRRQVPI
jgi:hypothetical protein